MEKVLTDLANKLTLPREPPVRLPPGAAANRDTEELAAYLQFKTIVDGCDEFKPWRPGVRPTSKPAEVRAAFDDFLLQLPGVGGPTLAISMQRPVRVRLGDVDPPNASQRSNLPAERPDRARSDLALVNLKLDRIIGQTAGSSEFALSDLLLPGFLVVCALAGLWALLIFVVGPSLEDRVALRVAEIIEHARRSGKQEGTALALQELTASVDRLQDIVLARRRLNVTGNPEDTRLERLRPERPLPPPPPPPFDADAFARDVMSAWKFARADLEPGPFSATYNAIGVDAHQLSDATVLRPTSGSVLHSPIWAISARHGDLYFVVPAPNLDVSELSVGGNRRAKECYEGVFTVEVGETDLLQVASGRQRGSEFVVERMGLLHLPGR